MGQYKEEDLIRWRGLVSEQVGSGKSIAAFSRERGLPVWQFYEWKKRLSSPEPATFVTVEVSEADVAPEQTKQISGIELRHRRGWSLIVEPGFDALHLRRLLSVLELES
jgi:hypothetical protein